MREIAEIEIGRRTSESRLSDRLGARVELSASGSIPGASATTPRAGDTSVANSTDLSVSVAVVMLRGCGARDERTEAKRLSQDADASPLRLHSQSAAFLILRQETASDVWRTSLDGERRQDECAPATLLSRLEIFPMTRHERRIRAVEVASHPSHNGVGVGIAALRLRLSEILRKH